MEQMHIEKSEGMNSSNPQKGQLLFECRDIAKTFSAVKALKKANIQLRAGEIHALVGGNGSGKSTLVNIMSGIFQQTDGELIIQGQRITLKNPIDAQNHGIGTVMQNLFLVDTFNAVDNLFLGREVFYNFPFVRLVNKKAMKKEARSRIDELGIDIPRMDIPVLRFSGGQRQAIACARALMGKSNILLMDEPTAALGVKETAEVFRLVENTRDKMAAVMIISHNMEEVFDLADYITVMRHGYTVATLKRSETTKEEIVGLITGAIDPLGIEA